MTVNVNELINEVIRESENPTPGSVATRVLALIKPEESRTALYVLLKQQAKHALGRIRNQSISSFRDSPERGFSRFGELTSTSLPTRLAVPRAKKIAA